MTRLLIATTALSLAATAASNGQQPAAPQAVVEKGRAPVSNQVLQVKLPRPQEADLSNGLHVMVLEDRRAPQVTMQLIVRGAGGYFDPPDHLGLAQFTAANMREQVSSGKKKTAKAAPEAAAKKVTPIKAAKNGAARKRKAS